MLKMVGWMLGHKNEEGFKRSESSYERIQDNHQVELPAREGCHARGKWLYVLQEVRELS